MSILNWRAAVSRKKEEAEVKELEPVNIDDAKPSRQDDPSDPFGQNEDDGSEEDPRSQAPFDLGPRRAGSDVTAYRNLDVDGPSGDQKVLRFFDFWDVRPGKTYTYRFRVWVDDPNHELAKEAASGGGNGGGQRGGRDGGGIAGVGGGGSSGGLDMGGPGDDPRDAPPGGRGG